MGRVHGMGDLVSRWRDLVVDGKPLVRGYFALGDILVRTNPLYGRGCSFAAVSAQALRQSLDRSPDPQARALDYHQRIEAELRPYYINQRAQDRSAIKRARQALTPGHRKGLRAKLVEGFFEDGVSIALRSDVTLLRQALRVPGADYQLGWGLRSSAAASPASLLKHCSARLGLSQATGWRAETAMPYPQERAVYPALLNANAR